MNAVLITGASSFPGCCVAKRLNASGVRPRVLELPGAPPAALERLEEIAGLRRSGAASPVGVQMEVAR